MNIRLHCKFVLLVSALAVLSGLASQPEESALFKRRNVAIKAPRIAQLVNELSREFSVPVCVEETRWFAAENASTDDRQILTQKRARGFDLVATNSTLKSILDLFVIDNPEYMWEFDTAANVVNLYPKEGAVTSRLVEIVAITNQTIEQMFWFETVKLPDQSIKRGALKDDPLHFRNLGILFAPSWGNHSWAQEKLNLTGGQISVRRVLNQICNQLSNPRYWIIEEIEKPITLRGNSEQENRAIRYHMRFCWYGVPDPKTDPLVQAIWGQQSSATNSIRKGNLNP